jgi:hypothetical protein
MAGKPQKTVEDYMVMALSPVLIMALVGSLCFFLIEIFYRGQDADGVRRVMFWFVLAIVLVSRIAIEESPERAALFGMALALAVWLYLIRTHPAYLLGIFLLAVVWYCANWLVWDCTLIDEDEDSCGQGLLQSAPREPSPPAPPGNPYQLNKPKRRRKASSAPGRSVVWFSLAALPLFGLGQVLLPAGETGSRRVGLGLLVVYLAAALGLLMTTSFLGLRRYLRQRYLKMPGVIALAWIKFGGGVAVLVLVAALFLPRPGAEAAWSELRVKVDGQLRQASQYAMRGNPHGQGPGRAAKDSGNSKNEGSGQPGSGTEQEKTPGQNGDHGPPAQNGGKGSSAASAENATVLTGQAASAYVFLRALALIVAALLAGWWLVRCRHLLGEIFRSGWRGLLDFFRRLLDLVPRKPVRPSAPEFIPPFRRPLAAFKNPFFAGKEYAMPPGDIIIYTYDALQAWAGEHGVEVKPQQTPREFCETMSAPMPEMAAPLRHLSYLYAHAAYGHHLPAHYDLEPLKEIWRRLTWK